MRIMIEEDLPQEKYRPHVPPFKSPQDRDSSSTLIQDLYDRPIGNVKQGSSSEVYQRPIALESGDTIQPNVEIVIQRDLSCTHCKYLFAHCAKLSKQVSGKLKVSNCIDKYLTTNSF